MLAARVRGHALAAREDLQAGTAQAHVQQLPGQRVRDALGTAGDLDVIVEAGTTAPPLGVLVGGLGQGLEQRALQTLEQAAATRAAYGEPEPFEVRIEELRPLVRALIAEEIERRLRTRDDGR